MHAFLLKTLIFLRLARRTAPIPKIRYTLGGEVLIYPSRSSTMYHILDYGEPTKAVCTEGAIDSIFNDCEITGGEFLDGIFYGGVFKGGTFYDGFYHDGEFYYGKFKGGTFYGGRFHRGSGTQYTASADMRYQVHKVYYRSETGNRVY